MAFCIGLLHGKYVNQYIENFIGDEFFCHFNTGIFCVSNKVFIHFKLRGQPWKKLINHKDIVSQFQLQREFFLPTELMKTGQA